MIIGCDRKRLEAELWASSKRLAKNLENKTKENIIRLYIRKFTLSLTKIV